MSGKYDFPNIKKAGTVALRAVLASTSWGLSLIKSPFNPLIDLILGQLVEFLADKGLIIINIGVIYVDGHIDQKKFDEAFNIALEKVKIPNLTPQEQEAIDEKVKNAFRDFARLNSKP